MSNPSQLYTALHQYSRAASRSYVILELSYSNATMSYEVRVSYDHRKGNKQYIYSARQEWGDEYFERARASEFLADVDLFTMSFVKSIPEDITGNYPHIRLWADINLDKDLSSQKLFGRPTLDIEGWVFGRYKTGTRGRYDNLAPNPNTKVFDNTIPNVLPSPTKVSQIKTLSTEEIEDGLEMAQAAKKRRVVKTQPPRIDPSKIKKPECVTHKEPMEFDPVKQKWRCQVPGCKVVARPARDDDDRSVQIGKGEVSLRIVSTEEETVLLLVSDDNVALNITPLVTSVKVLLDSIGAIDLASTAYEEGNNSFVDTVERPVQFDVRVGAIGVEHLLDQFGDIDPT